MKRSAVRFRWINAGLVIVLLSVLNTVGLGTAKAAAKAPSLLHCSLDRRFQAHSRLIRRLQLTRTIVFALKVIGLDMPGHGTRVE